MTDAEMSCSFIYNVFYYGTFAICLISRFAATGCFRAPHYDDVYLHTVKKKPYKNWIISFLMKNPTNLNTEKNT